jgi:hypothetical protein
VVLELKLELELVGSHSLAKHTYINASTRHFTMEETLSAQFDRVEKALSTLVDSIAAYNPSPQAAIDLVAADDELSQGLDQRK